MSHVVAAMMPDMDIDDQCSKADLIFMFLATLLFNKSLANIIYLEGLYLLKLPCNHNHNYS